MRYLLLSVLLTSCSVRLTSDPIIVKHTLDLAALEPYCKSKCESNEDPDSCTLKCINDFLETLGNISAE